MYNTERYALTDSHLKVESIFINKIHKHTGVYTFPFHKHDDFLEISLVIDGEEQIEFKDETYHAKAGDVIIKNKGLLHQEEGKSNEGLVELSIGISGVQLAGLEENTLIGERIVPVVPAGDMMPVLRELFLAIEAMYKDSVTSYAPTIHLAVNTFVSIVLLVLDKNGRQKGNKVKRDQQIEKVLQYIDAHFEKNISLDTVAKEFCLSPYYLARKFKMDVGYTVNQYIQSRRLGKAEQRLAFEDTPIKEIALECGFSNLKYFYSLFKAKTGHTPNEFRCLLRSNQENL